MRPIDTVGQSYLLASITGKPRNEYMLSGEKGEDMFNRCPKGFIVEDESDSNPILVGFLQTWDKGIRYIHGYQGNWFVREYTVKKWDIIGKE